MRAMKMNHQANGDLGTTGTALCTTGDNSGFGGHSGVGYGQRGGSSGEHLFLSTIPEGSVVLSADAAAGLIYMIEEEKMARDLYDAFAEQTGSLVFDRISDSEQKHLDSLVLLAQKAAIDISSASTTAGVFTNTAIQSLYDTLLAQGSVSLDAAFDVGVLVEQTDISDLQNYSADIEIGIVGTVYAHLEAGSEHHLAAFSQQAALL